MVSMMEVLQVLRDARMTPSARKSERHEWKTPAGQLRRTGGVIRGGRKTSSPTRCGDSGDGRELRSSSDTRGAGTAGTSDDCHRGAGLTAPDPPLHARRTGSSMSVSAGLLWTHVQGLSGFLGQTFWWWVWAQRCVPHASWTCWTSSCMGPTCSSSAPTSSAASGPLHCGHRNGRNAAHMGRRLGRW